MAADRESELIEAGWTKIGSGVRMTLVDSEDGSPVYRQERLSAWRNATGREMVEGTITVGSELIKDEGGTVPEGGSLGEYASQVASRLGLSEYVFQSCVTAAERSKS